jgi:hypothetical protein
LRCPMTHPKYWLTHPPIVSSFCSSGSSLSVPDSMVSSVDIEDVDAGAGVLPCPFPSLPEGPGGVGDHSPRFLKSTNTSWHCPIRRSLRVSRTNLRLHLATKGILGDCEPGSKAHSLQLQEQSSLLLEKASLPGPVPHIPCLHLQLCKHTVSMHAYCLTHTPI